MASDTRKARELATQLQAIGFNRMTGDIGVQRPRRGRRLKPTFFYFEGQTIATQPDGKQWVADGQQDLTPYGFKKEED